MKIANFFAELKRRNVYKVAVAYAVIAWLLIQAGSILFPTFEAPGWVMKVFVAIIAAGFPIALAFDGMPVGYLSGPQPFQGDVTRIIGMRVYLYAIERRFSEAFQALGQEGNYSGLGAGLAQIEARADAVEEAVKRLRHLLSIPAGQRISIARLKIDPVWDPIRTRPDFQQLLSGPEQIGPKR